MAKERPPETAIVLIQLVLAYEWLYSGLTKFAKPDFMAGISQTLGVFAGKTKFPWYGRFLLTAEPKVFGNITRFSEILIGLGLLLGAVYLLGRRLPKWLFWLMALAAGEGFLLNLNLYLASSWSGPSTAGINVVMGFTELIIAGYYFNLGRH